MLSIQNIKGNGYTLYISNSKIHHHLCYICVVKFIFIGKKFSDFIMYVWYRRKVKSTKYISKIKLKKFNF